MKKTFKKQMILFAVVAVMMILALVMPASAEGDIPCPGMNGGAHLDKYIDEVVCPPTCTQRGYTTEYCTYCQKDVIDAKDFTDPTGHNFAVSYEYDAENSTYTRVRTCQNDWLCTRLGKDPESGFSSEVEIETYVEKENGYYLVEYVNNWEPLDKNADAAAHRDAHLAEYYVENSPVTWVLDCESLTVPSAEFYASKVYTTGTKVTVDGTKATAAYEYINQDGSLKLFVKDSAEIPAYDGLVPSRGKDLTYGQYAFTGWTESGTADGVKTFEANFEGKAVNVSGVYYNYNGVMLSTGKTVPYGEEVSYGDLVTPAKESDQKYNYTLLGWAFDKNQTAPEKIYPITGKVKIYYNTNFFAVYKSELNKYNVNFVDYYGNRFSAGNALLDGMTGVTCGSSLADHIRNINADELNIPRDKQYIYQQDVSKWIIKEVNGNALSREVTVNPYAFDLPRSVLVTDKDTKTSKEIFLGEGDTVTLTPKYDRYVVSYTFKIKIHPGLFRPEDYYEVGKELKSELVDDFIIQVTDNSGRYIADGKTNANGEFTFTAPYRDALIITATIDSGKYRGEHVIDLASCADAAAIERIEKNGIDILPKVTQDWLDGLKGCSCICHSILSPIVVRIYNILYKIFGIEYVCCDDLFIVHGNILSYGRK